MRPRSGNIRYVTKNHERRVSHRRSLHCEPNRAQAVPAKTKVPHTKKIAIGVFAISGVANAVAGGWLTSQTHEDAQSCRTAAISNNPIDKAFGLSQLCSSEVNANNAGRLLFSAGIVMTAGATAATVQARRPNIIARVKTAVLANPITL